MLFFNFSFSLFKFQMIIVKILIQKASFFIILNLNFFSTGFLSTHGWNSLDVAEKIVQFFEKD